MIIKREEAHKFWCPFARVPSEVYEAVMNRERDGSINVKHNCLGDRCMAWVRTGPITKNNSDARGFCGLVQYERR